MSLSFNYGDVLPPRRMKHEAAEVQTLSLHTLGLELALIRSRIIIFFRSSRQVPATFNNPDTVNVETDGETSENQI